MDSQEIQTNLDRWYIYSNLYIHYIRFEWVGAYIDANSINDQTQYCGITVCGDVLMDDHFIPFINIELDYDKIDNHNMFFHLCVDEYKYTDRLFYDMINKMPIGHCRRIIITWP